MSLAIDAIILLGVIIIIWCAAVRGFFRSVMSLAGGIASFFAAYAYSPMLAEYIKEKFLLKGITDSIEGTLRSLADPQKTGEFNLDKLAIDTPKALSDILERYNIEPEAFIPKFSGLTSCGSDVVRGFAEDIATPAANIISSVVAFIALFFGVWLILWIITGLLDLIFKLPMLKRANSVLGILFGAVESVFFASVAATALSALVSALGSIDPNLFGESAVEQTIICKFIVEHNPLDMILGYFMN
jgi:uncharacterized membrane protein required for colicin V production